MSSAISVVVVFIVVSPCCVGVFRAGPAEGNDGGEQASGFAAPGECATELDRVDHVRFATSACGEDAAGVAGQLEREGLAVTAGPFGDHVGDDAAVVFGSQNELAAGCTGGVDPVHPRVAEVDDVDEISECPLFDHRGIDADLRGPHEAGSTCAALDGLGCNVLETFEELLGRQVFAFGDLDR